MEKFVANTTIQINADEKAVWKGLTDPVLIKQYFFGTNAESDWKKGSPVRFRGEWEGQPYEDKGTILESDPPRRLRYNYWSSFSGKADVPENYAIVTYQLRNEGNGTQLTVTQDGLDSAEAKAHTEGNWKSILDGMKKIVEA
jgi:uncharacterized protein YndB with AHSA1/START domain